TGRGMHTFVDPLRRALAVAGSDVAVVCGPDRLTYAETWARCRRLAGTLHELGLQRGDRVALIGANCHRYLEAYYAVPAAGFVLVPLNSRWSPAELRYALEDSQARVLITDRDPGELAGVVEHVVTLSDGYDAVLASSPDADLGVGIGEDELAG